MWDLYILHIQYYILYYTYKYMCMYMNTHIYVHTHMYKIRKQIDGCRGGRKKMDEGAQRVQICRYKMSKF